MNLDMMQQSGKGAAWEKLKKTLTGTRDRDRDLDPLTLLPSHVTLIRRLILSVVVSVSVDTHLSWIQHLYNVWGNGYHLEKSVVQYMCQYVSLAEKPDLLWRNIQTFLNNDVTQVSLYMNGCSCLISKQMSKWLHTHTVLHMQTNQLLNKNLSPEYK